jgi:tetratricopeptide (TPR) repeat protein
MARYEEGLEHLELAIERHHESGAVLNEALALTNLGRAQHILGSIDDARVSWERALQLFSDLGHPNGELSARTMLGSALGAYGEHDLAREHLRTSIELAERIGSKDRLVEAHRELADLDHSTGARREAWEHIEAALAIEEEVGSARSLVMTLAVAGKLALAEEDWSRAAELLSRAVPDARSGVAAPLVLSRLARALAGAGRAEEAEEYAREALEGVEAATNVSTLNGPEIYCTLADFQGDPAARENFLSLARAIVEERARRIGNDTWREHFLLRTWPNAEILESTEVRSTAGPAA